MKRLVSPLVLLFVVSAAAFASGTFTIVPVTVNPAPGQTGTAEILLTNTGSASILVAAFGWIISTADPDVTFTAADTSTTLAPYIFAGDSLDDLNAFTLNSNSLPASLINASDLTNDNTDITLNPGDTFSLGEFFYHVSATAFPGPFSIDFSNPIGDSLSDSQGNTVASSLGSSLTLQIVTPEPAAFAPLLLIAAGAVWRGARRRR